MVQIVGSSNLSAGVETPSLTADCLHNNTSGLNKYQRYHNRHRKRLKQERLERYWADPEAARKKARDHSNKHPELTKFIHRRSRARRKLKNPNLDRDNYQRNRAKKQAASRAARRANPEKVAASYHRWLKNNRQKALAASRRWKAANKARIDEYRRTHKAEFCHYTSHRKALKKGSQVDPRGIARFIASIRKRWVKCYYCSVRIHGSTAHIDHILPLSRGGRHAVDNLCAACQPCNNQKHSKLLTEWKRDGQQVLPF